MNMLTVFDQQRDSRHRLRGVVRHSMLAETGLGRGPGSSLGPRLAETRDQARTEASQSHSASRRNLVVMTELRCTTLFYFYKNLE